LLISNNIYFACTSASQFNPLKPWRQRRYQCRRPRQILTKLTLNLYNGLDASAGSYLIACLIAYAKVFRLLRLTKATVKKTNVAHSLIMNDDLPLPIRCRAICILGCSNGGGFVKQGKL